MAERKTYTIGEKTFFQEELVWGQIRWANVILKQYMAKSMSVPEVMELFSDKLPRLLAVVLVEEGTTQADKVRAGEPGLVKLEEWFLGTLRPSEATPVIQDFFALTDVRKMLDSLFPRTQVTVKEIGSAVA